MLLTRQYFKDTEDGHTHDLRYKNSEWPRLAESTLMFDTCDEAVDLYIASMHTSRVALPHVLPSRP